MCTAHQQADFLESMASASLHMKTNAIITTILPWAEHKVVWLYDHLWSLWSAITAMFSHRPPLPTPSLLVTEREILCALQTLLSNI